MALRAVRDHENAPKPLEVFGFGRAHEVNSSEPADEFSREKSKVFRSGLSAPVDHLQPRHFCLFDF